MGAGPAGEHPELAVVASAFVALWSDLEPLLYPQVLLLASEHR